MQGQEPNREGSMCLSGCGFHGSSITGGYCSVCFKKQSSNNADQVQTAVLSNQRRSSELIRRMESLTLPVEKIDVTPVNLQKQKTISSPSARVEVEKTESTTEETSSEAQAAAVEEPIKKPKRNRCETCRKRVGLTGITCRCGGLYCGLHRYTDTHGCTFDYKAMGAEEIRTNNPVVIAQKINKI